MDLIKPGILDINLYMYYKLFFDEKEIANRQNSTSNRPDSIRRKTSSILLTGRDAYGVNTRVLIAH